MPGAETELRGPHAQHYSTTSDLTLFFQALLRGWLLPPAQQKQMFAATATPEGKWIPNTTYGLGMSSIKLSCGTTVWGMGGAINGSFSFTYGTRDGRHMMAQNLNGDWNNPIGTFLQALDAEERQEHDRLFMSARGGRAPDVPR